MSADHQFPERFNPFNWTVSRTLTLTRFALVGLFSAGVYALIMVVVTSTNALGPGLSSAVAYLATMPINFLLQRSFTFASNGAYLVESWRYIVVHSVNLLVSVAIVDLIVQVLDWPVLTAVAVVVVVVPLIQFFVLELWVFPRATRKAH